MQFVYLILQVGLHFLQLILVLQLPLVQERGLISHSILFLSEHATQLCLATHPTPVLHHGRRKRTVILVAFISSGALPEHLEFAAYWIALHVHQLHLLA